MRLLFIFLSFLIALITNAQTLKPAMHELGDLFRDISKNAMTANADQESKNQVLRLHEVLLEAKELLPPKIDRNNEIQVEQYKGMIAELVGLSMQLEESFSAQPFNKDVALKILTQMNEVKKKGHALFK